MMQQEFVNEVNDILESNYTSIADLCLNEEQWAIIQTVYMYHPSIPTKIGKRKIAELYLDFGMCVINDMYSRAIKLRDLDNIIYQRRSQINKLEQEILEIQQDIEAEKLK
jgi:hypothetical protein